MRSFRVVARRRSAHCLEAALAAACILEHHGLPPLLLDMESRDRLDHVVFPFRRAGRWGAVGGSRDVGLFGRRPAFRSLEALVRSYYDPYVTADARLTGWAVVDLRTLGRYDWRFSERNVWIVERVLLRASHRPLVTSDARYIRLQRRYREFVVDHDPRETPFTRRNRHWM